MVHLTTLFIRSHYIVSHDVLINEQGGMWKEAVWFHLMCYQLIGDLGDRAI